MIESPKRSLLKSIIWRIFAVVTLAAFSYQATGDLDATISITAGYHIIQIILFYIHERVWANIEWGFVERNKKHLKGERK